MVVHSIDASGDVLVRVTVDKSGKHAVTSQGVSVTLNGDALVVKAPARADGEQPTVTLFTDAVAALSSSGVAKIEAAGLGSGAAKAKSLSIKAAGASSIRVDGKVTDATVDASGTAHVDAAALGAVNATVTLQDAARAELRVTGALTAKLKRASRLTVTGKPSSVQKTVDGVAKLVLE